MFKGYNIQFNVNNNLLYRDTKKLLYVYYNI